MVVLPAGPKMADEANPGSTDSVAMDCEYAKKNKKITTGYFGAW